MLVVEVFGYSFAGKTTFIEKFLSNEVVYDIKDFYTEHEINPKRFVSDVEHRETMSKMVERDFFLKLKEAKKKNKLLVVEHVINFALRRIITQLNHITIWIITPMPEIAKRIKQYGRPLRFDVDELNEKALEVYRQGRIKYDTKYFTEYDLFYPDLDISFLKEMI